MNSLPRNYAASLVVAVTAAVFVACNEPTPRDVLNGDDICRLVALLEDESYRDEESMELRSDALAGLRRRVDEGGDALRDAAIEQVRTGNRDERKHAQLVLAQVPTLTPDLVGDLLDHADPEVWVWAHITTRFENGVRHARDTRLDVELEDLVRPFTAAPDRLPDDEPLIAVADAIRERLRGDPETDAIRREYILETFATEIDPVRAAFWRHVPRAKRRFVDLDGDGVDEVVVVAMRGRRDRDAADRCHALCFIAVIGRDGSGAWSLDAYHEVDWSERLDDILVADLDGDGRRECIVRYTVIGGWCWGRVATVTRSRIDSPHVASFPDQRFSLVRRPSGGEALLIAAEGYTTLDTGKAIYLSSAMSYEYRLYRWTGDALEQVGAVYVP